MLPPDVEPVTRETCPRRGDGAGIVLALVAALSGGFVSFLAGVLIGRMTS